MRRKRMRQIALSLALLLLCGCAAQRPLQTAAPAETSVSEPPEETSKATVETTEPVVETVPVENTTEPVTETAQTDAPAETTEAPTLAVPIENEETEANDMPRILCIGDSNTYGYDPHSFLGERYEEELRWTWLLSQEGYNVLNQGVNGAVVPRQSALPGMLQTVENSLPLDGIIVMLGTNDLCCGCEVEETAEAMEALLLDLQETAPEAKLVLIAPPSVDLGNSPPAQKIAQKFPDLAEAYQTLAECLQITFADAGQWGIALGDDGVHFSPEGVAVFAEHITALIREIL